MISPLAISAEEGTTNPSDEIIETEETSEEVLEDDDSGTAIEGTEVEITTDETENTDDAKTANIFTRLYEAFINNKSEIFTLGGSGILFVLSMLLKKDLGTSSKSLANTISSVLAKTDLSAERQEAIVGGLNEMIDGYENIKQQSDYVREKMGEFDEAVKSVVNSNKEFETKVTAMFELVMNLIDKEIIQNAEVMEVLSTVYTNNGAIPKGIKDFIALKRSENAKIVQEAATICHTEPPKDGETK
jgi:hypothetical protein